jgi:hypothetical protein
MILTFAEDVKPQEKAAPKNYKALIVFDQVDDNNLSISIKQKITTGEVKVIFNDCHVPEYKSLQNVQCMSNSL